MVKCLVNQLLKNKNMKKNYFIYLFFIVSITNNFLLGQIVLDKTETISRKVEAPNNIILKNGFRASANTTGNFHAFITKNNSNPQNPDNPEEPNNPDDSNLNNKYFHDTSGNIDVDGGGQLQYSFPIALPPGVKSVAPQLNLIYSSNSTNGIAGYGWSLSGVSSISRIGRNIEKDGSLKNIELNYNDLFQFNGQRLVLLSGEYGKDGAIYKTEKILKY